MEKQKPLQGHLPSSSTYVLSVSFFSASSDTQNYSVLERMEPGRPGMLLPSSWVSHSNKSKLAVTTARLGSCCCASESILFHWVSVRCQTDTRQQVIMAPRNEEAQHNFSQMASCTWSMNYSYRNVHTDSQQQDYDSVQSITCCLQGSFKEM